MSAKLRVSAALVIASASAVVGCNPNGTCIRHEGLSDSCAVNMTKGTCGARGESARRRSRAR